MAAPATAVDICNLALDKLGQREISATGLTAPATEIEKICTRHYEQTKRKVLRKYIFKFAKKYATIAVSTTVTPTFGYSYAYTLPTGWLRLLTIGDITIGDDTPPGLYDISDGHIFTNESTPLKVTYIYDAVTVANYDPLFIDVFVLELAAAMAYKFTLKPSMVKDLKAELLDAQISAAAISGQEKPPRRIQRSKIVDARRYGYRTRNTTRYPF
jgi:hypothetical protein